MNDVKNWFAGADVASLYGRGRPYHHERTLARAFELLPPGPRNRALDVACGTGMSSRALARHVDEVVGIDAVESMARAAYAQGVPCAVASAEELPFSDACFDGLTVSSAVHWFDQDKFFSEATRVLRADGWALVYDLHFLAEIEDDPRFGQWMTERWVVRYPKPARSPLWLGEDRDPPGFERIGEDTFIDPIPMTHDRLVAFFLTMSNTIAPIESGDHSRDEARTWLEIETAPFFHERDTRTFSFKSVFAAFAPSKRYG